MGAPHARPKEKQREKGGTNGRAAGAPPQKIRERGTTNCARRRRALKRNRGGMGDMPEIELDGACGAYFHLILSLVCFVFYFDSDFNFYF